MKGMLRFCCYCWFFIRLNEFCFGYSLVMNQKQNYSSSRNSRFPLSRIQFFNGLKNASISGMAFLGYPDISSAATAPKKQQTIRLPDDVEALQPQNSNGMSLNFRTLPSGVQIEDIEIGSGPEVLPGSVVVIQWVLRRSNGYFVDSSVSHDFDPFIYRVGDLTKALEGFDIGIKGMKQGGKRRLLIPPQLGYTKGVGDNKPGPMPSGYGPRQQIKIRANIEPVFFEVEVTKVKNKTL